MNYNNHEMDITTIVGCAINCSYCPQKQTTLSYNSQDSRKMSFKTFEECLMKIPKKVKINFSGYAEPFLNYECKKMIVFADKMGYKISLYTTLVGINESDLISLSHIPFSSVDIHLPTILGEEKIRIDQKYKQKLKLALNLLTNSSCVEMSFDGNMLNIPSDFVENVTIHKVSINSRSGNLDDKFISKHKRSGILLCDKNLKSNVLLPNGDVTICCQDFGLSHIIGNLLNNDYENLFSSNEYNLVKSNLSDEGRDSLCRYCEYAIEV